MGMVTEMHLREEAPEKERFNYKGMHRYLITLLPRHKAVSLCRRESTLVTLGALRESAQEHEFDVIAYCFLPERLVMVVRGKTEASDMKNFLSGFRGREKSAVAPAASMFARRYQERVLRKTEETRVVADEVFHMPVKAGPSAYEFQGSFVYPSVEKPEKPRKDFRKRGESPRRSFGKTARRPRHPRR
jgi:hypothetical protein